MLTVVVGDDVQTVEELSLVFMDSFDLNVEHGNGVDLHLVVLLQMHSKLHFVFLQDQNNDLEFKCTCVFVFFTYTYVNSQLF